MKWIVGIVITLLLCPGCVPTTEDIRTLNNDVDRLMVKVDDYQEKYSAVVDNYKEKVFEEIDEIQEKVEVVNEAMKGQEGLVESISAGIEASKPFNPYANEMSLVLALLAALGGKKLYSTTKEKKGLAVENAGLKNGVARFEGENDPAVAGVLHETVKKEILKANGKS